VGICSSVRLAPSGVFGAGTGRVFEESKTDIIGERMGGRWKGTSSCKRARTRKKQVTGGEVRKKTFGRLD